MHGGDSSGDSLGRRYLVKLLSNAATIPLFFVMEAVLPRALGPALYGNFNFATALYLNFTNFLDMGTSTCLNTALAKRPQEAGLPAFYARVALAVLLLCLLAGLAAFVPGLGPALLPGVPPWMALPAALWAYVTWAGRVARGMNDALGYTVQSEPVRIGVNVLSALSLLLLFGLGLLSLPLLFVQQYVALGLLAGGFLLVMRGNWREGQSRGAAAVLRLTAEERRTYTREFWRYSAPLFVTALCSALVLSGERWLLQFFDGSVEQGYFSLSQKIGMACFLFVSALTPLLMRELAVAHGRKDPAAMARLLDRYAPIIYAVSAWMACFVLAEAPAVVRLFGGAAFAEALLPVQIMALYPIHQGYGQVAAAVFYATGQTRLLRNISILTLLGGLGAAWLLLAPPALGGLALGAGGLAWKMVLIQFLTVNLLFWAARRFVPFNFGRNLAHQLICPLVFLALALAARFATERLGLGPADGLFRFFVSGVLYCALCGIPAFAAPFVLGLRRGELTSQARRLLHSLGGKR